MLNFYAIKSNLSTMNDFLATKLHTKTAMLSRKTFNAEYN